ncbi:HNH endonuclease [Ornithinimicrobium sp. Arc0846-15]|nr:HNH endonuclease [Ornithinimicrobium laminariae]
MGTQTIGTGGAVSTERLVEALRSAGLRTDALGHDAPTLDALGQLASISKAATTDSESARRRQTEPSTANEDLVTAAKACVDLARWCDGMLLSICRSMALRAGDMVLQQWGVDASELSPTKAHRWRATTKSAVATELQALSGWGIQSCHDRVGVALTPPALSGHIESALKDGWNDTRAVQDFWRKARHLDLDDAACVAQASFGPVVDGDGVCQRASHAEFGQRLTTALAAIAHPEDEQQRQRALDDRDCFSSIDDDGTGTIVTTGPLTKVAAAAMRIDTIARKTRAAGDSRTLAQLRADLSLALLTHGILPDENDALTDEGSTRSDITPIAEPGPLLRAALGRHSAPIALEVIVPLDALVTDTSRGIGHLPGFGALTGAEVREIAQTPGTVIHRLLTDPVDGRCIERSTQAYRPDKTMLDQLKALDRTCRGPGCTVEASRCQPDHEIPFDEGGPTAESNLALKHGYHHNNKTLQLWESELHADRRITWTTLFGQKFSTRPHDYSSLQPLGHTPTKPQGHDEPGRDGPERGGSGHGGSERTGSGHDGSGHDGSGHGGSERGGPGRDDNDLAYQLLTRSWLAGDGDRRGHPGLDYNRLADESDSADAAELTSLIALRHRTPGGQLRRGPHPRHIQEAEFAIQETRQQAVETPTESDDPPPF